MKKALLTLSVLLASIAIAFAAFKAISTNPETNQESIVIQLDDETSSNVNTLLKCGGDDEEKTDTDSDKCGEGKKDEGDCDKDEKKEGEDKKCGGDDSDEEKKCS